MGEQGQKGVRGTWPDIGSIVVANVSAEDYHC